RLDKRECWSQGRRAMFKRTIQLWAIKTGDRLANDWSIPYTPARSFEVMYVLCEEKRIAARLLKSGLRFEPANKTSRVVPVRVEIREVSAREGKAWETDRKNWLSKFLAKPAKGKK